VPVPQAVAYRCGDDDLPVRTACTSSGMPEEQNDRDSDRIAEFVV